MWNEVNYSLAYRQGNSPSLSAKIKRELEETYDESYGEYIELLGLARKKIIEENKDIKERRKK